MRRLALLLAVVVLSLLALLPASAAPVLGIPRLAHPFIVDGDLTEWSSTACLPVCTAGDVNHQAAGEVHKWRGPADASFEASVAWTPAGLCFGLRVVDDEVLNTKPVGDAWQMDCVDLFVDGRAVPGQQYYGKGVYQILCKPPVGGAAPEVHPVSGEIAGAQIAARRTPSGYTEEVLIPWTAFPEFAPAPGRVLGLQIGLDDADARDDGATQPRMLTVGGAVGLASRADRFLAAVLVDQLEAGPDRPLDSVASLSLDNSLDLSGPLSARLLLSSQAPSGATAVRFTADRGRGLPIFTQTVPTRALPAPWSALRSAVLTWKPTTLADGEYRLRATVLVGSRPVGVLDRPFTVLGGQIRRLRPRVAQVDLAALARENPYRAASALPLLSVLERVEASTIRKDLALARQGLEELQARLALLEHGRVSPEAPDLMRLLNLAAVPEAQVTLEYASLGTGHIALWWGAVPIATASVSDLGTPERARAAAEAPYRPYPEGAARASAAVGSLLYHAYGPTAELARRFLDLLVADEPITLAQADAYRAALAAAITPAGMQPLAVEGARLYCGDVHMHTYFSDGRPSPAALLLEAMYTGQDFSVMTDHNTLAGAQLAQKQLPACGFAVPLIVGEEITTNFVHMCAYPLHERVDPQLPLYDFVRAAHAQGAVVQWNHPGYTESDWELSHVATGLAGTGLDAWEHVPDDYAKWKAEGRLPQLVGSTDNHGCDPGSWPERTLILAPSPSGVDVAEAIRWGRAVLVSPVHARLFYGPDDMVAAACAALAEGKTLKAQRAAALRGYLEKANFAALLKASTPLRP